MVSIRARAWASSGRSGTTAVRRIVLDPLRVLSQKGREASRAAFLCRRKPTVSCARFFSKGSVLASPAWRTRRPPSGGRPPAPLQPGLPWPPGRENLPGPGDRAERFTPTDRRFAAPSLRRLLPISAPLSGHTLRTNLPPLATTLPCAARRPPQTVQASALTDGRLPRPHSVSPRDRDAFRPSPAPGGHTHGDAPPRGRNGNSSLREALAQTCARLSLARGFSRVCGEGWRREQVSGNAREGVAVASGQRAPAGRPPGPREPVPPSGGRGSTVSAVAPPVRQSTGLSHRCPPVPPGPARAFARRGG